MSDMHAVNTIRCLAADMVQTANSGHPGMPLGMAPVAYVLWKEFMNFNPSNPGWLNRDRFVLSNGHGCALLYSMLHLTGYDLPMDQLKKFRQVGSITPGHPENHLTPGVEVTTGPLGQGIANAVGMSLMHQHLRAMFPSLFTHRIFCFAGDGCLQEGVALEAISLAGHWGSEMVLIWDDNKISIDGSTDLSFTEDVPAKFRACGWEVLTVHHGDTDLDEIRRVLAQAVEVKGKPVMVQLKTTIGYGSALAGSEKAHGSPLGPENLKALKRTFFGSDDWSFRVEDSVYATFAEAAARGRTAEDEWNTKMQQVAAEVAGDEKLKRALDVLLHGNDDAWKAALPRFKPGDKDLATRQVSELVINALSPTLPFFIGGSADLTPSTLTYMKGLKDFQKNSPEGRNIHFGIREHGMTAVCNGIAAYAPAVVPYCATFLNFIGYAAGAVRVAALSHAGVIYVATHDSIGLGEDGPTHQPIEILSMLRAMPNMLVLRPADGNEVSGAYAVALTHRRTPTLIALSRQGLPQLEGSDVDKVALGGYVLYEPEGGAPEAILVGTGSEVQLCVKAAKSYNKRVRVVSMPSCELFDLQSVEYRRSVLPDGVPVMSVEALSTLGWERYSHAQIGMRTFGVSGPVKDVINHFGFHPERVHADLGRLLEFYSSRPVPSLVDRPF